MKTEHIHGDVLITQNNHCNPLKIPNHVSSSAVFNANFTSEGQTNNKKLSVNIAQQIIPISCLGRNLIVNWKNNLYETFNNISVIILHHFYFTSVFYSCCVFNMLVFYFNKKKPKPQTTVFFQCKISKQ